MAVKIRLARRGAKKRPYYKVVVADARSPRDGKFIDIIGSYNPLLPKDSAERFVINNEKAQEWISKGAQPTETIARLMKAKKA
jgi:small subunit ribosomal protein S16